MCDASTAVSIIQRYVDEHLFSPSFTWPKYEFRKRSYQQWAAYEICDRIMDKPFDDPITVIENFMFEMAMYACYGEDEQRSFILDARQMLSYLGWIDCTDTYLMYRKWIKPCVSFQQLKRKVSRYDKYDEKRVYQKLVSLYTAKGGKSHGVKLQVRREHSPADCT